MPYGIAAGNWLTVCSEGRGTLSQANTESRGDR